MWSNFKPHMEDDAIHDAAFLLRCLFLALPRDRVLPDPKTGLPLKSAAEEGRHTFVRRYSRPFIELVISRLGKGERPPPHMPIVVLTESLYWFMFPKLSNDHTRKKFEPPPGGRYRINELRWTFPKNAPLTEKELDKACREAAAEFSIARWQEEL